MVLRRGTLIDRPSRGHKMDIQAVRVKELLDYVGVPIMARDAINVVGNEEIDFACFDEVDHFAETLTFLRDFGRLCDRERADNIEVKALGGRDGPFFIFSRCVALGLRLGRNESRERPFFSFGKDPGELHKFGKDF